MAAYFINRIKLITNAQRSAGGLQEPHLLAQQLHPIPQPPSQGQEQEHGQDLDQGQHLQAPELHQSSQVPEEAEERLPPQGQQRQEQDLRLNPQGRQSRRLYDDQLRQHPAPLTSQPLRIHPQQQPPVHHTPRRFLIDHQPTLVSLTAHQSHALEV